MYDELSSASDAERALVADVVTMDRSTDRHRDCERYLPPLFNHDELAWQLERLLRAS